MRCADTPVLVCLTAVSNSIVIPFVINCSCNCTSFERIEDSKRQQEQQTFHCEVMLLMLMCAAAREAELFSYIVSKLDTIRLPL